MKFLYFIFFIVCLYSCSTQLYIPKISNTIENKKLLEGRTLYINHCGSCHNLYAPNTYPKTEWMMQLNNMQVRAKINNEEKEFIYSYLVYKP